MLLGVLSPQVHILHGGNMGALGGALGGNMGALGNMGAW